MQHTVTVGVGLWAVAVRACNTRAYLCCQHEASFIRWRWQGTFTGSRFTQLSLARRHLAYHSAG